MDLGTPLVEGDPDVVDSRHPEPAAEPSDVCSFAGPDRVDGVATGADRPHLHGNATPVIVEAVGPLYHWTGRISEYTGLPAVIGWDWHQIQQRTDYTELVQQRRFATEQFYRVPDRQFALDYIEKYNVRYVIVGTEERYWGSPDGVPKFAQMPELEEVYRNHIEPRVPLPDVDQVRAQLEHMQKNRQVLFATGNSVNQECRAIMGEISRALSTLQRNAADRARQKRSAKREKGKHF